MHIFDQDIAVTEQRPGIYRASVAPNWSIHGAPNGGYLMALMARAMLRQTENSSFPIITANFLARSDPGPAEVEVDLIARSSQFDRFEARLHQEGQERVRAFGIFAGENGGFEEKRYERPGPAVAAVKDCLPVPEIPNYSLYSNMDVLLDPACAGWMAGSLRDKSEIKGWIRFKEDRPLDVYAILLMSDAFPPAVLVSHGMIAWLPTIEFSLSVRSIPKSGWLKCAFRTFFVNNGMLEEDGEMWDEDGNLVAISRQYAQMRKEKP